MEQEYLGDGVYAVYDGMSIILDLRQQDDSRIVLEPEVLAKLNEFAKRTMLRPTTSDGHVDMFSDD